MTAATLDGLLTEEDRNRLAKAKLIARHAWRHGLTWPDLAALPWSSRRRSDRTLLRFVHEAYRASPDPADHDRNPPHSFHSRTWAFVDIKLRAAETDRAAGEDWVPVQDLLHERHLWTGDAPTEPALELVRDVDAPTPVAPVFPPGVIACGPHAPTPGDVAAVAEFAAQVRQLREEPQCVPPSQPPTPTTPTSPAPAAAGTPSGSTTTTADAPTSTPASGSSPSNPPAPTSSSTPGSPAPAAPADGSDHLPKGWAELATLPPLDYGWCIRHADRRPVVITMDGGRCPECPPRRRELRLGFVPTKQQAAAGLVEHHGVQDGWGVDVDWTPKPHMPGRCYCGRCPGGA